ncbi:MAG: hypothetical protein ACLPKI_05430 [Streptosporangiaceae bacterium]
MSSDDDNPVRRLVAAWESASGIAAEWAERTAAVTAESFRKLTNDPAIRAALAAWRVVFVWERMDCECDCAVSHPDDVAVCDQRAVITRRLNGTSGPVDVPLCAPCAVAQGVAEMRR